MYMSWYKSGMKIDKDTYRGEWKVIDCRWRRKIVHLMNIQWKWDLEVRNIVFKFSIMKIKDEGFGWVISYWWI